LFLIAGLVLSAPVGEAHNASPLEKRKESRKPLPRRMKHPPAARFNWLGPDRFAGRIRSILVHPSNADIIYAGAATGGIWKTTDGGQSWVSLDDFMPTQVIGSLAMDPADPNTIYAGTGEIFTFFAEGLWLRGQDRGRGIFVSRDAGATWNALASTQTQNADWRFVNRIAIDPSSSSHLFAATGTALWESTDAGQTFRRVLTGVFLDVKIHPLEPSNVVASRMGGPTAFSSNFGVSWSEASFPAGTLTADTRVELAPVTQTAQRWRALVLRRAPTPASPPSRVIGLFASSNRGQTFKSIGSPSSNWSGDCDQTNRVYTGALWVDPQEESRLLIASTHLCRTTNDGTTVTRIVAPEDLLFTDFHAIVSQPGSSADILVGHDQGLRRIPDYTAASPTIEDLNNGLRTTQFHSAVADPVTQNVFGGTQDTGILLRNGASWTRIIHGDGSMASFGNGFFYGARDQATVRRVEVDGSNDLCISATGSAPLLESRNDSDQGCGNPPLTPFCANLTPLLIDRNDPNRLYVGCRQLWRTADARAGNPANVDWSSVKSADDNHVISSLDIANGNASLMWVGTRRLASTNPQDVDNSGGRLWKSTNATNASPTFTRMDAGKGLPGRPVADLVIDPRDSQKVYVSYAGHAANNVWVSSNGGTSFSDIGAGLPPVPVWALAVHPTQAGWLYAGTDVGLYVSTDDGATWSATTRGPATVAISDLQWRGESNGLTLATYGRGVHEFDATPNPEQVAPETLAQELGSSLSGRVENLIASDNKYFIAQSESKGGVQSVGVVLTTRGGFSRAATASSSDLAFFVESRSSTTATRTIELFNFTTSRYESLASGPSTAGPDQNVGVALDARARDFIDPTTRQLRARLSWTRTSAFPFTVRIDSASWFVLRP
jgi:photosystem II stability/assembly factor-like uncharacterized protein